MLYKYDILLDCNLKGKILYDILISYLKGGR